MSQHFYVNMRHLFLLVEGHLPEGLFWNCEQNFYIYLM